MAILLMCEPQFTPIPRESWSIIDTSLCMIHTLHIHWEMIINGSCLHIGKYSFNTFPKTRTLFLNMRSLIDTCYLLYCQVNPVNKRKCFRKSINTYSMNICKSNIYLCICVLIFTWKHTNLNHCVISTSFQREMLLFSLFTLCTRDNVNEAIV